MLYIWTFNQSCKKKKKKGRRRRRKQFGKPEAKGPRTALVFPLLSLYLCIKLPCKHGSCSASPGVQSSFPFLYFLWRRACGTELTSLIQTWFRNFIKTSEQMILSLPKALYANFFFKYPDHRRPVIISTCRVWVIRKKMVWRMVQITRGKELKIPKRVKGYGYRHPSKTTSEGLNLPNFQDHNICPKTSSWSQIASHFILSWNISDVSVGMVSFGLTPPTTTGNEGSLDDLMRMKTM